ncbi:DUF5689 domain-containing protein [Rufibacter glacialis]|uniref:DUF5689 domain-containing protein n=1 Tax=Rufibacter glacialis TaxID=1259555 RepID=A0A5M8QJL3_9BACT|nr:DUF5689 domain-containing protein [Rufibacter glacialis]KAA6435351.1 hypothetical protein FOE74_05200 [Rufibacter glacialis]
MSLADVRALYRGEEVTLTREKMAGAHQVVGVVISDPSSGNFPSNQVIIQNTRRKLTRGIVLQFGTPSSTPLVVGDSVVVETEGAALKSINGALHITGLQPSAVTKVKSGITVNPRTVSLEALVNKPGDYEGTLVKIVAGNITPTPTRTSTYSGDKQMTDGNGNNIILHTQSTATFAQERLWPSATYTGVPLAGVNPQAQTPTLLLSLRSINDVEDQSGPLYPGFPETFDNPSLVKDSYNMNPLRGVVDNTIDFSTGSWKLFYSIVGQTPGRDRFTGTWGIRMQDGRPANQSPYVQMNFDLPNGASKVTYIYGAYYTDASSTWWIEYSQDKGKTWKKVGPTMTEAGNWTRTATVLMDISGPVRFRLFKQGLGANNPPAVFNGRFAFDNFAVYAGVE